MGLLLNEIKANQSERKGGTPNRLLGIMKWDLCFDEAQELTEALNDKSISPSAIVNVLKKRGIDVTRGSIYRWRAVES